MKVGEGALDTSESGCVLEQGLNGRNEVLPTLHCNEVYCRCNAATPTTLFAQFVGGKLPRRMPSTPGAEATLAASLVEACRRWEIPLEKNRSAAMVSRIFEKSGESRQARVAMIIAEQAYPELALKGRTLNGLFSVVRGSSPKQGHLAVEDLEAIYSDECNTRDMGLLALSFVFPGATKEEIEQAFDAARHVFDSTATLQANRVSLQRHHEQNALHRDHERDTRKSAKRHGTRRPQKR